MYSGGQSVDLLSETSRNRCYDSVNESAVLASLADSFNFSILLLDGAGNIIFSNCCTADPSELPAGMMFSDHNCIEFTDQRLSRLFLAQLGDRRSKCGLEWNEFSPTQSSIEIDNVLYEFCPWTPAARESSHENSYCLVSIFQDVGWCATIEQDFKNRYNLTAAELEVCKYLFDSESTKVIARQRCTSAHTVKSQLQSVLRKTKCRNRTELTVRLHRASVKLLRSGKNSQ